MTWIQTYTGRQFWPLDPNPEDVHIDDIAHALGNMCRFNGHCKRFYSVAEHSIGVTDVALRLPFAKQLDISAKVHYARLALLHDATEAYLPDVTRPIKPSWPDFPVIEHRVLRAVLSAMDVPWNDEHWEHVKYADDIMLATEARDLMGRPPKRWAALPRPRLRRIHARADGADPGRLLWLAVTDPTQMILDAEVDA
jgi:uncharacterized protein